MFSIDKDASIKLIEKGYLVFKRFGSTRLLALAAFLLTIMIIVRANPEQAAHALNLAFLATIGTLVTYILRPHGMGAESSAAPAEAPAPPSLTKIIAAVVVLIGALLAASWAWSDTVNPGVYNPTPEQEAKLWREIGIQTKQHQAAKAEWKETGDSQSFHDAIALAVFPIQRAWLLNNRAYAYINRGGYDLAGLEAAERWLLEALEYTVEELNRYGGDSGAAACRAKIESNLIYVRTRIEAEK